MDKAILWGIIGGWCIQWGSGKQSFSWIELQICFTGDWWFYATILTLLLGIEPNKKEWMWVNLGIGMHEHVSNHIYIYDNSGNY